MEPSAASKRAYKNKCSFSGCKNNNNTSSLFKFPVKDKHRQAVWIKNSGNPHLKALNDQQLRNHFLCQEHFGEEYLLHRHTKTILTRSAIPYPFKQDDLYSPKVLKVKTPIKVYGRKRSNIDVLKLSSPVSASPSSSHEEPPKYQLKPKKLIFKEKKVTKLVKQNKALKEKVRRLKSKMSKDLFSNQLFKSDVSKLLTSMQTSFGKYRKSWSVKEKNFCLSLYYKSPSAYKFLLNSGVVLAASSTVQRWLAKSNYTPGINKEVFHQLKLKFADSTEKEKSCVLCFDEMSIMKNLEYSKKFDLIEGFEDLGHGKRNNKIAHYTLVFMIRGLYNNWKAPIAYFLSNSNVKADNLLHLIKAILNKLIQSGMLPKAMVCDQMTINQQVHRKLGVTLEKPYFELNTSKIYCLFDTPHLIKNIRNNFIGSDFMFENKILSFQDIITVYEINKNNDSSALTKLTPIHLNPNAFQKMKVSLATQVFSHSVAAAIRTAHSTGELKSKTARDTADFIEYVNNLFDALNSKNKIDKNPYCCALTVNNTLAKNALTNGHNIFRNLHKVSLNNKNDKIIVKTTRPPSFDGFVQTIEAVLQLTAQETNNGIKFVMTNRLNQDVLENLFSL